MFENYEEKDYDNYNSYNVNYNPYSTSASRVDFEYNHFGYGPSSIMLDGDLTGASAYYDWGVYNTIGVDDPGTWRTLSQSEWKYLFRVRPNAENLFGVAMVNGVNGLILLPDNWITPSEISFTAGCSSSGGSSSGGYYKMLNNYTLNQWKTMEDNGAVFFPAAGERIGNNVDFVGFYGYYWSTTRFSDNACYISCLKFDSGLVSAILYHGDIDSRSGISVRLVKDVE